MIMLWWHHHQGDATTISNVFEDDNGGADDGDDDDADELCTAVETTIGVTSEHIVGSPCVKYHHWNKLRNTAGKLHDNPFFCLLSNSDTV